MEFPDYVSLRRQGDTNSTSGSTGANATNSTGNSTMPKHFVVLTVTMPYTKVREDSKNVDFSSVFACRRAHTDSRYA